MKIIALEAENVKHLRVVNIKPDGSLVVIGGDNSAGKTCVFDSIEYALNGASSIPPKPIREGQKKARVVLDLGDIVVTRTFTKKGTNLVVKSKDGTNFASPQIMLNKLTGELTFDPLEFSRMDANKQAEVLKKLVGLDFDEEDADYKELFAERTNINRDGKAAKARLDSMTKHEGVPDTEESVGELSKQYAEATEINLKIGSMRGSLSTDEKALERKREELDSLKHQIEQLTDTIEQQEQYLDERKEVDAVSIRTKMDEAETTNRKVRENQAYDVIDKEVDELRKQSGSLSTKMNKITSYKEMVLTDIEYPIKGLAVDDDGVTFEGIPFVQCSSAQRIRISVAIGLKMNPKLRILLIREGSLLDEKNLAMIAKMAEDADAQIWLERVSKGSECTVIMEDGSILSKEMIDG